MTDKPETGNVHELAGGWIRERTGTQIPTFLKLTYIGFCLFGLYYLFTYWKGEVAHASRGPLVLEINKVMETPGAVWFAVIAVILIAFIAGLLAFAFRSGAGEE